MEVELTEGCIEDIFEGRNIGNPIVQVLGITRVNCGFVEISDGVFCTTAVASADKNLKKLIFNKELQRNDVVVLEDYVCEKSNTARGKWWTLVILKMSILEKGDVVGKQIGNPTPTTKEHQFKKRGELEKFHLSRTRRPETLPIVALNPTNDHWCIKARVVKKGDIQKPGEESLNANLSNSSNSTLATACNVVRRKFYDMFCKFHDFMAQIARKGVIRESSEELYCLDLSNGVFTMIYYIFHYLFHYVFGQFYDLMARISNKQEFFNVELTDSSGSITATAYNSACFKFYDVLELNKVFLIRKFSIRRDETSHKFKLILKADSEIVPAFENIQFNFYKSYKDLVANTSIDILGVCIGAADLESFKDGESRKRRIREVSLKNEDGGITVFLFDDAAEQFDISTTPVVAMKGAKVEEVDGFKWAVVNHASQIFINPDIEEARRVKNWYKMDTKAKNLRPRVSPPQSSAFQ
ncbi:replication protein A 70 kDa DNA-binding subunit-like isoform X2 [Planococcus citri]|uniref:replication protein A 70 kDa DNA-binding subunit-like isoform X2 n=1 Tax=Planococcus citri TaxID=170843 RepID=UPI0031FA302B